MPIIGVAFLRVNHDDEGRGAGPRVGRMACSCILSPLVLWYMSRSTFTHCEPYVRGEDVEPSESYVTAYTVTQLSNGVERKERMFSSTMYEMVDIRVSDRQLSLFTNFCDRQLRKPMDEWGMLLSPIPLLRKTSDNKSWFCAELTVAALKKVGLFRQRNPASVSMDEIYTTLCRDTRRVHSFKPTTMRRLLSGVLRDKEGDEEDEDEDI